MGPKLVEMVVTHFAGEKTEAQGVDFPTASCGSCCPRLPGHHRQSQPRRYVPGQGTRQPPLPLWDNFIYFFMVLKNVYILEIFTITVPSSIISKYYS